MVTKVTMVRHLFSLSHHGGNPLRVPENPTTVVEREERDVEFPEGILGHYFLSLHLVPLPFLYGAVYEWKAEAVIQ